MRVEQNPMSSVPTTTPSDKAADSKKKVTQDDSTVGSAPGPNRLEARQRISRWFARAGVAPARADLSIKQDVDKRIRRYQATKQQRKLQNLENILELALEFSVSPAKEEDLDPDWFFAFSELAENIHSPAMQSLWGKIFAMELSQPGSFSLKTLQILQQLTQRDAQVFRRAVNLSSRRKGESSLRLIFGFYRKPSMFSVLKMKKNHQINLAQYGLAYPDLLTLMDLGLIYKSEIESGEQPKHQRSEWRCGNSTFHLAANSSGLILNYYKFTSSGNELAKLLNATPPEAYLSGLKDVLREGFEVV